MKRYLCLPNLTKLPEEYTHHPNLTAEAFVQIVLTVITRSATPLDATVQWFDVWDRLMNYFTLVSVTDAPVYPGIVPMRITVRGTILDYSDAVTDITDAALKMAQENFHTLRPFLQQYPNDIWDQWSVVEISPAGILVEVTHAKLCA